MALADNPIVYLTRKLWRFSEGRRHHVILFYTGFIIANIFGLLEPLVLAKILNIIQEQGITQDNLLTLLLLPGLIILIYFGFWVFHGPSRILENRNAFFIRAQYKKYLLDGIMGLPSEWHTSHHSGDTIDKVEKGAQGLYDFSRDTFEVTETVVRFIGSYIALAYFNLHSSYIVLFMVILTISIILKFDNTLIRQYLALYKAENKISAKIFDTLSNITTVIILRVEALLSKAIMKQIMLPFKLFMKNHKVNEVKWFLVSMCSATMVFLVMGSYILITWKTNSVIMVGTLYALYDYVHKINNLFYRFAYKYGNIVLQKTAVMNVEEIASSFRKKTKRRGKVLSGRWNEIHIKNLNFSYHQEKGADLHLDNISFSIKKKQKIAFIGESGSGKTTMLKIIRDLYHPKSGSIFVDEEKLKLGFLNISDCISLIPQDPEIFSTTIKENITLGVPHKLSFIKKFTDIACFTKVAESLPQGFQSSIVEKGVNLSGGQKQRLALARGLLASVDKPIMLLDEPTSSVDAKNELKIYKNILRSCREKTIISSIHRLHLLPLFDHIFFFQNGKIIDQGSFDDLLKNSKKFKALWKKYRATHKRDSA